MPGSVAVPLPRTTLASYLVLARAPVGDPDIVVSSTAGQLTPSSAAALGEHIGDLRILPLGDLADAPVPPEELLRETDARIGAWQRFGRQLCGSFLEVAERSLARRHGSAAPI